jgi:hypothetical protein
VLSVVLFVVPAATLSEALVPRLGARRVIPAGLVLLAAGCRSPDDVEVHCAAAAIIAVSAAVVRHWVERDGAEDLVALYDRPFRLLAEGLRF